MVTPGDDYSNYRNVNPQDTAVLALQVHSREVVPYDATPKDYNPKDYLITQIILSNLLNVVNKNKCVKLVQCP